MKSYILDKVFDKNKTKNYSKIISLNPKKESLLGYVTIFSLNIEEQFGRHIYDYVTSKDFCELSNVFKKNKTKDGTSTKISKSDFILFKEVSSRYRVRFYIDRKSKEKNKKTHEYQCWMQDYILDDVFVKQYKPFYPDYYLLCLDSPISQEIYYYITITNFCGLAKDFRDNQRWTGNYLCTTISPYVFGCLKDSSREYQILYDEKWNC